MKNVEYYTKDKELLRSKVQKLFDTSAENVKFIADFDATISDPLSYSSYCVVERSEFASETFKTGCNALYAKYHPLSTDISLTEDEKIPLMEEWSNGANECIKKERFTRETFTKMLDQANTQVRLRDHCDAVVKLFKDLEIPFVIFSAGVANVINSVMEHRYGCLKAANIHVAGNMLEYDEEDLICGFMQAPVHVFNKNEATLRNLLGLESTLHGRDVAIIAGDSIGDAAICADADNASVLRFGFLHVPEGRNREEYIQRYCDFFDVVMVEEKSLGALHAVAEAYSRVRGGAAAAVALDTFCENIQEYPSRK